jgi:hypothetical protein
MLLALMRERPSAEKLTVARPALAGSPA